MLVLIWQVVLMLMTDEQKLKLLLKVLKEYAEKEHCYEYNEEYRSDIPPNYPFDEIFDTGAEFGEILFARTLLEQIGVEFEHPVMKEND